MKKKFPPLKKKNIFSLKFKQIQDTGIFSDEISSALKESCPQTWGIEEAQQEIEKTFGKKYALEKCVGTGTIAQTFSAKDTQSGKNVCIKMIHKGISKEKILQDKEKMIALINAADVNEKEKKFLIDNLEDIAQSVLREVDLTNEMTAAQKIANVTKQAKVVQPIEVKNNIYVMEKANGVSLASLNKYMSSSYFNLYKKEGQYFVKCGNGEEYLFEDYIKKYEYNAQDLLKLKKILEQNPELENLNLTKKEVIKMLEQYQNVLIEQFNQVGSKGKTIHGDIHSGNIFIDIDKLKNGDKNFFTLIDTGNTIEQTQQQAIRAINLQRYIRNADCENIAKFVLENATLPEGMTQQQAQSAFVKELKKIFFDNETAIQMLNTDSLKIITDKITKDLGIIPSSVQGSLIKAKQSANNSLTELYTLYGTRFENEIKNNLNDNEDMATKIKTAGAALVSMGKDIANLKTKNTIKVKFQERANIAKLPVSERIKIKKGNAIPDKNSKEYLTYLLKQFKINLKIDNNSESVIKPPKLELN